MKRLLILFLSVSLFAPVVSQTRKTVQRKSTVTTRKSTTVKRKSTVTTRKSSQKRSKPSLQTNITNLKSQRSNLQKNITKNETLLRSLNKNVKTQLSNLSVLNSRIESQRKIVDGIASEVTLLTNNLNELNHQLGKLKEELDDRRMKYRRSMVYLYRNRSWQNKLMFIFSGKSFTEMVRRWRYVRDYASFQRLLGEQVERKQQQVEAKQEEVNKAKIEKDDLLQKGRDEQVRLEGQQKERETLVNGLKKRQKEVQSTLTQSRKRYASLNSQIDRLIQQQILEEQRRQEAERRRREAAEAAARKRKEERERAAQIAAARKEGKPVPKVTEKSRSESAAGNSSSSSSKGSGFVLSSKEQALSNNFTANRGRLPMPITGAYMITQHYGQYNVSGLSNVRLDNKGINITGKSGASARSIFDGEVTAIFSLGGYRNVLVRHGSYISVYCNLSSVSVSRGQHVSTRQVLGAVARDASGNCTLHFQLRKEKTALNPESWLSR